MADQLGSYERMTDAEKREFLRKRAEPVAQDTELRERVEKALEDILDAIARASEVVSKESGPNSVPEGRCFVSDPIENLRELVTTLTPTIEF